MKIKLSHLILHCKKKVETIDFSHVSFFHGQISSGKSSIARLVDFCLGNELQRTPAMQSELIAVSLEAKIGNYTVLFEREASGSNQIQVTWQDESQRGTSLLVPVDAGSKPILDEDVYNISDLLFYLGGISPPKVRKSKQRDDSPLVRLSFRDLMWYCYLQQERLDSSFYRLEDTFHRYKSQDVIRYLVGYYSERMVDLEKEIEQLLDERRAKTSAVDEIVRFLGGFGYESVSIVQKEMSETEENLRKARMELSSLNKERSQGPHIADDLRNKLRNSATVLSEEETALRDLQRKIEEEEALRAELITSKVKFTKAGKAESILSGVQFKKCPACGSDLVGENEFNSKSCTLCKQHIGQQKDLNPDELLAIQKDFSERITELEVAIEKEIAALDQQRKRVAQLKEEKAKDDQRLGELMKDYDSAFLAKGRETESLIGTLEERLRHIRKSLEMLSSIDRIKKRIEDIAFDLTKKREELAHEQAGLHEADEIIKAIEDEFKNALLNVKVPGVVEDDTVRLDRKSWIMEIATAGDQALTWDFYRAGSAGKKTLVNVCYALAIHKVASEFDLPIPTLLIIDTPMKNIGEDVNRTIFESFYRYLYELASNELSGTQFIIIDKEYIPPSIKGMDIIERYMTPDRDDAPPLISYYRGA